RTDGECPDDVQGTRGGGLPPVRDLAVHATGPRVLGPNRLSVAPVRRLPLTGDRPTRQPSVPPRLGAQGRRRREPSRRRRAEVICWGRGATASDCRRSV